MLSTTVVIGALRVKINNSEHIFSHKLLHSHSNNHGIFKQKIQKRERSLYVGKDKKYYRTKGFAFVIGWYVEKVSI